MNIGSGDCSVKWGHVFFTDNARVCNCGYVYADGRVRYLTFQFSEEQLELIVEGLAMLRLYQNGFIDVDGRAKSTAIRKLEDRIQRRLQRKEQREKQNTDSGCAVSER